MGSSSVPRLALGLLAAALVLYARIVPLWLPGVAPAARPDLEWVGPDGRTHVYLGDYDSYLWLRHARTLLATGTPCDAVVDGVCWDTYAAAPVGRPTRYARSLHVYALAGLQRVVTLAFPRMPLSATAYWLPVLIGVLGVLPAFAIGMRLAGPVAGFAAAVTIGVNSLFLDRSLGADNDVWNVVLPLFAVWGAIVALTGGSRPTRAAGAAGAALATVLHAATWSGWVLTAAVVGLGLPAGALHRVLAAARAGRAVRPVIEDAVLMLVAFCLVLAIGTASVGEMGRLLALPWRLLHHVLPGVAFAAAPAPLEWPDVFRMVGELSRSGLAVIAASLGGQRLFFVAWLGLLLLTLPRRGWHWWHFAILLLGNFLYAHLLRTPGLTTRTVTALVAMPLAGAIVLDLAFPGARPERSGAEDDRRAAALPVVAWFLGAFSQAWVAIRFVMLLVPAFGIAFGVALGRLDEWTARLVMPRVGAWGRRLRPVIAAVVLLATVPAIRDGLGAARRYQPLVNDAWWDTLTEIRRTTPPDAIVTTWWDYGHWVKYVADRRTTADGSTLLTYAPYWIARALLAPTEGEAAGLLRMLNCGSASASTGAWARLVAHGMEPTAAHRAVIELARRDRPRAAAWLAGRGLDPAAIDDVLRDTHCEPPASYLVLTSALLGGSWRVIGGWDPVRSWLVSAPPDTDRVATLTSRFGVDPDDAAALVTSWDAARASGDPDARAEFERPRGWLVSPDWLPCERTEGGLECPVDRPVDRKGTIVERVLIDPARPEATRLRVRRPDQPATDGAPASLVVARPGGLARLVPDAPPMDVRLGALVDLRMRRVLLGAPDVIASTFVQLHFLGGRDAPRFVRTGDRRSVRGERVSTWRVRMDDDAASDDR